MRVGAVDFGKAGSTEPGGLMLFSVSIVKLAILLFLLAAVAVVTFITPLRGNSKSNLRDYALHRRLAGTRPFL